MFRPSNDILETFNARFPDTVSPSMYETFKTCPTKWFYTYVIRRTPSEGISTHPHFGSCFATGLEHYKKSRIKGEPHDVALAVGARAALEEYGDHEPEAGGTASAKTSDRLYDALIYYTEHAWPMKTDEMQLYRDQVEFKFALPVDEQLVHPETNDPILVVGRVDWTGERSDGIWGVDEKTTSGIGPKWADKWPMRGQFHCYTWAYRQHGIPVRGIQTRGIAILKGSFKHAEYDCEFEDWQIDEWKQEFIATIQEMIQYYKANVYRMNFADGCNSYNTPCQYMSLCTTKNKMPWLKMMNERSTWAEREARAKEAEA